MKGKPSGQQHDFHRDEGHAAPWDLFEQRQRNLGEDVGVDGPAASQNGCAGPRHVRRIRGIAGQLERIVDFYGSAQVQLTARVQGPAVVLTLIRTKINRDLAFQLRVHFVHEVHHENVLGGYAAVRLELVAPVALRELLGA